MSQEHLSSGAQPPDSMPAEPPPSTPPAGERHALTGHFREAFEQSPSSTVVYDTDGRPIAVNRAFERLWGVRLADVPEGYSVLADPQLEAAGVLPLLRRAFGLDGARSPEGEGEAVTLPPLRYDIASAAGRGRTLWTQAHAYPVRGANGRIERVVLSHDDITARRMAELKLRESEERYRTLFESIDDGFCVIQVIVDDAGRPVDYRFLETNPAFVKQTGLMNAVGKTARELVPDLEQHWVDAYGRVALTGQAVRFENGSEPMGGRWFDVYAFRIGTAEDRRVAVLFTDVTATRAAARERERLLAALELEQSRLTYVFEHAPAFLAVMRGPDYVFEFVNNAYYQLVGHRELIGKPLFEALPEVRNQGFEELMQRVMETGETYTGREQSVMLRRSPEAEPEERFIDLVYLPVVEDGDVRAGVIAHGTDVSEQVRARREVERARDRADRLQRLTAALAATNTPEEVAEVVVAQGIQATGATTAVLAVRERVLGGAANGNSDDVVLLRQQGLPEHLGGTLARYPITDQGPAAVCLRTGEAFFMSSRESVLERFPEVRDRWEALHTVAFATIPLAVAGQPIAAMSFTWAFPREIAAEERDFFLAFAAQAAQALERARLLTAERSARAAAESARMAAERARREADEANQAKSAFLATMSHEIRTPINAQIGYAQLMELGIAGPVTDEQRRYLARLAATSEHLRGLVDDILDLAKIDAGGMTVARELSHTGPLVGSALDLVRPQANAKGVRLIDARAGEMGEPFVGDEHRVRQILANLLSNAVKFTRPGGSVTVRCGMRTDTPAGAELSGGGPWIFIEVTDTGIGIAAEDQARIFEPFHQVDSRHTRQQGGTGLGLAISRRLARLMGGDQTLVSTPGVGSTFTLWLPAGPDRRESVAERGARARQGGPSPRVHGLAEVGTVLRERAEEVIAAYAARLRADPAFARASYLQRSEVEDHQLTFVVDIAQTLVAIEESGSSDSDILRDGSTIQRVVAELHGAMRQRRGWTEAQLEREYAILKEEMHSVVRRRTEADGDLRFALGVLERMIERAYMAGLAALRRAAESYQVNGGQGA